MGADPDLEHWLLLTAEDVFFGYSANDKLRRNGAMPRRPKSHRTISCRGKDPTLPVW
ncbi:hypothetical protein SERLADRAFT_365590 [Serpula lacrymans var. lacrymans S7.9]|uniref:Uncharacterized protein n=1 Tax=Serpula lacrymans var. lacrymans (strain S7.9) TaxID=578457 RepID=F8NGV2_SERL9|nr:uncharacterized protein SERLADRAFT_365590 [Serpula lacrymans var. lacrymans S7.9]EGO29594.1 hypothetical protein SERLADRAFT_365590 [Serpula lacrymans var. lacrymans S7.9]